MMIRVCVLPQEMNSSQTRSKKAAVAWFADRHMQVLARKCVEMIVLSNWLL